MIVTIEMILVLWVGVLTTVVIMLGIKYYYFVYEQNTRNSKQDGFNALLNKECWKKVKK